MFLLPNCHVQIKTRLTKDTVVQRLAEQIEPHKFVPIPGMFRKHKYFEGEISGGYFKINRIPPRRYTFTPFITGKIQANDDQTIIDMRIHFDILEQITIITSILALIFVFFCYSLLLFLSHQSMTGFVQFLISSFTVPLIFYILVLFSFNFKAHNILNYLTDMLEGKKQEM